MLHIDPRPSRFSSSVRTFSRLSVVLVALFGVVDAAADDRHDDRHDDRRDEQRQAWQGSGIRGGRERCDRDVRAAFADVDSALKVLGDEVDRTGDKKARRRLRDDLTATIRAVERARLTACAEAEGGPPVVIAPPPPPPVRVVTVMEEGTFRDLLQGVKNASFSDRKRDLVRTALPPDMCLTTDQVRRLLGTMNFSSDRMEMARIAVPHIVDRDRAFTLESTMSFSSEKAELNKVIRDGAALGACIP